MNNKLKEIKKELKALIEDFDGDLDGGGYKDYDGGYTRKFTKLIKQAYSLGKEEGVREAKEKIQTEIDRIENMDEEELEASGEFEIDVEAEGYISGLEEAKTLLGKEKDKV